MEIRFLAMKPLEVSTCNNIVRLGIRWCSRVMCTTSRGVCVLDRVLWLFVATWPGSPRSSSQRCLSLAKGPTRTGFHVSYGQHSYLMIWDG